MDRETSLTHLVNEALYMAETGRRDMEELERWEEGAEGFLDAKINFDDGEDQWTSVLREVPYFGNKSARMANFTIPIEEEVSDEDVA